MGFGISTRDDVQSLRGKADMAIVGTAAIELVDREGPAALGPYIRGLLED